MASITQAKKENYKLDFVKIKKMLCSKKQPHEAEKTIVKGVEKL
jgi:hypothetical protein